MELVIRFLLPHHHRSVSTTQGFVFLTGGVDKGPNEPVKQQKALRNAYILNIQKRQLVSVAKMLIGRLEQSLAVVNDEIYAIGGYTDTSEPTTTCEKYSHATSTISRLHPGVRWHLRRLQQQSNGPEIHEVLAVNEHELPTAEAFWSQQAIVFDRKVFALQNMTQETRPPPYLSR